MFLVCFCIQEDYKNSICLPKNSYFKQIKLKQIKSFTYIDSEANILTPNFIGKKTDLIPHGK